MDPQNESPVNPLPPLIVALFLIIIGIEAAFYLGNKGLIGGAEAVGWRLSALQSYAFSGDIFQWMWNNGQYPFEHVTRFITYVFVHGSFTQALFAGVILLAMGKMVGEVVHPLGVLFIFLLSAAMGALLYGTFADTQYPLIGAYPSVYGLIGAYTYLLWLKLGLMGEAQVRAFSLIGFLMGIQLLFGLLFGGRPDWIADLGGFATGFLSVILLVPGGFARLRDRMRHR